MPASPATQRQRRLRELLLSLAPSEGYTPSPIDAVRWLRSDRPLERTPVLYEPGLVFVCQGRKRGFLGDRTIVYDALHYLAVAVPVPFTMETDASAEEPLLAVYVRLDRMLAAEVALAIDEAGDPREAAGNGRPPLGLEATPMDERIEGSLLRFLEAMSDPLESAVLGPALLRELYFRVLAGEQGATLRAAIGERGHLGRIARSLKRIHADHATKLDVGSLAREAGLGLAAFHQHFKAVTQTTPMQYLKSTRLHRARLLMLRQGLTAAAASDQVGYGSASQFSREFRRLFGRTPQAEVARMRASFAIPEQRDETFVSSH
ncbi:AraC family transcriptional regulator [Mitsuaria sp. GD03876]|uniref:AraC family transcriptional regulator n=1 Tax=Mitsuaria sp. GD03876 TaxID=2975399 RepID=UPI0024491C12|nr:AraC family transcriptional regulator [Mitsuaria sp. GD03876]MDH0866368.1 AraC family transcriptional regulator [Mitsuaria sp. GD03876]